MERVWVSAFLEPVEHLGERLRALRKLLGLTQEELGGCLDAGSPGSAKAMVARIEAGQVPGGVRLRKLSERLGCSSDLLLSGSSRSLGEVLRYYVRPRMDLAPPAAAVFRAARIFLGMALRLEHADVNDPRAAEFTTAANRLFYLAESDASACAELMRAKPGAAADLQTLLAALPAPEAALARYDGASRYRALVLRHWTRDADPETEALLDPAQATRGDRVGAPAHASPSTPTSATTAATAAATTAAKAAATAGDAAQDSTQDSTFPEKDAPASQPGEGGTREAGTYPAALSPPTVVDRATLAPEPSDETDGCTVWRLLETGRMSVLEEVIQPDGAETAHAHDGVDQFLYILSGEARIMIDGATFSLQAGQGVRVLAGARHELANPGAKPLAFLAIHTPTAAPNAP